MLDEAGSTSCRGARSRPWDTDRGVTGADERAGRGPQDARQPVHSTPAVPRGVLVTGGSNGIGRAVVERFARGGDRVWLTYRTGRQRGLGVAAELSACGWDVEAFEFDQGNWSSHERLLERLPGPVDVLVNNAAAGSKTIERYVTGPAHEVEAAFLQINSVGPLWLIRQILPGMLTPRES